MNERQYVNISYTRIGLESSKITRVPTRILWLPTFYTTCMYADTAAANIVPVGVGYGYKLSTIA